MGKSIILSTNATCSAYHKILLSITHREGMHGSASQKCKKKKRHVEEIDQNLLRSTAYNCICIYIITSNNSHTIFCEEKGVAKLWVHRNLLCVM